jgi:hypothetical protein
VSDASVIEESEDGDEDHVMDPSDPRAHGRQQIVAKRDVGKSRWDSDAEEQDDEEEVDEDLGMPVEMDDSDEDEAANETKSAGEQAAIAEKLKARLSSWAAARFLVPRSERPLPVLEEPPIEPLNDFILSDFGTRFRGHAGDVAVEKAIDLVDVDLVSDDDQDSQSKLTVGAPLYEDNDTKKKKDSKLKEDRKDKSNDAAVKKRRPESRYFVTDLATKCFNCGQVGHVSAVCANDRVQKPCHYCALRGHNAFACPHLPCSACLQLGHEQRDCASNSANKSNGKRASSTSNVYKGCSLCGRAGHDHHSCDTRTSLATVTCMVCASVGHLHCAPIPPPADRRVYCPYCAGNHTLPRCRDYVPPAAMSFSARLPRADMKCFLCNTAGHLAAECPKRTGYNGGNSCFNCGERGHYANDCPRPRGSNSTSGRKRGRNEHYADEYDDEDAMGGRRGRNRHARYVEDNDDEDEEQYYYVPDSGRKKPRLDAALPSYRTTNSNSSNKRNDRRRWY